VLIVHGRSGAGEVVDLINLQLKRVNNIVAHELEIRVVEQVLDIRLTPSKEVVHTDDFVPLKEEPFREMGAEKSGSAGD
jgi:hypothetical protein